MPTRDGPDTQSFVEEGMVDLLGNLCTHARGLGLRNALCIMPPESGNPGFRDWNRAASIPGLDDFGTDPYWVSYGFDAATYVAGNARRTVQVAERHGLDHHVWIQGFEIPAGREAEVEVAIEAAADAGATNLAVWSYDGCSAMSTCACANPGEVWRATARAFRALRASE
jgi:hypothetical protein